MTYRMFHVKLIPDAASSAHRRSGLTRPTLRILAGLLMAWAIPPANAAVFKCTGADGKVAYSDQPCVAGQAGTTVKPAAVPDKNTAKSSSKDSGVDTSQDPSAAARSAAQERIRAGQTPQCLAMGDRISSMIGTGAVGVAAAEVKATLDRYEQQCVAPGKAAIAAENARNEAKQKKIMLDEECKYMRQLLDERRPQLASLSSDDKKAFAASEANVARVCR